MRIDRLLKTSWPSFSFEFMAPRSQDEVARLFEAISDLKGLGPTFVCVTCRHSSRDATVELVGKLRRETDLEVMAHVACYGTTRAEMSDLLDRLQLYGVDNVLALRGDIEDASLYERSVRENLAHASDLVELIARRPAFSVGGACYPEGHPEASRQDDVRFAKLKQDAGAAFFITQLFFENQAYFSYVKAARSAGITVPILPGIFPITSAKQIRAVRRMGAGVPEQLEAEIDARADDPGAVAQFGVAWATLQCTNLLAGGAPGIHFYTFNRSPATRAILGALRAAKPWEWKSATEVA
jgi:methylenetetrahydrofolate reductase (NADPH)